MNTRRKGIAEIRLTELENEALCVLSQNTGKAESDLLHEALQGYLRQSAKNKRLTLLRQAKGLWRDRKDVPEVRELRAEMDR